MEAKDVDKNTGAFTPATKNNLKNLHLSDDEIISLNLVHKLKQECAALIANPYITDAERQFVISLQKCLLPQHNTNRSMQTMLQQFQEQLKTAPPKHTWTNPFANFWSRIMRCFGLLEETKLQQLSTAELTQTQGLFPAFKTALAENKQKNDAAMFFINEFDTALTSKDTFDSIMKNVTIFNAFDSRAHHLADLISKNNFFNKAFDENGKLIASAITISPDSYNQITLEEQKEHRRYHFLQELHTVETSLHSRCGNAFDKCTDLEKFQIHTLISTIDTKARNTFSLPLSPPNVWPMTRSVHQEMLRSQEPSTYSTKVQAYLKKMAPQIIEKIREPSAEIKPSQSPSQPPRI